MSARAARLRRLLPSANRVLGQPGRVAVMVALVLLIAGSLCAPTAAQAQNPLDLLPSLPNLNPASWAVDGFKAILKFIFGDDLKQLAEHLVNLLLAVPLLSDTAKFPQLNEYRSYIGSAAWGILGLSLVVASLRYWLSSYSGSGAYQALTGFARVVGAIVVLLLFPIVFDQLSRFVNAFTAALVINPIVGENLGKGLVSTITIPSSGGIAMLIGIAAIGLALVLLVVKVIVTALLAVLFVLSPLAIALWPIEEFSWAMRNLIQAMFGLLIFPILWAVCFGTFAVLSVDALFGGHGDLINSVLGPLFSLASLIVAFRLPFAVLRQALNAGIAPGINRAIQTTYYARSFARVGAAR